MSHVVIMDCTENLLNSHKLILMELYQTIHP